MSGLLPFLSKPRSIYSLISKKRGFPIISSVTLIPIAFSDPSNKVVIHPPIDLLIL